MQSSTALLPPPRALPITPVRAAVLIQVRDSRKAPMLAVAGKSNGLSGDLPLYGIFQLCPLCASVSAIPATVMNAQKRSFAQGQDGGKSALHFKPSLNARHFIRVAVAESVLPLREKGFTIT